MALAEIRQGVEQRYDQLKKGFEVLKKGVDGLGQSPRTALRGAATLALATGMIVGPDIVQNFVPESSVKPNHKVEDATWYGKNRLAAANLIREVLGAQVAFSQEESPTFEYNELGFNLYRVPAGVELARVDGGPPKRGEFANDPRFPSLFGIGFDQRGKLVVDPALMDERDPNNSPSFWRNEVQRTRGATQIMGPENKRLFTSNEEAVIIWNGGFGYWTGEEMWLELQGTEGYTSGEQGDNVFLDLLQMLARDGTRRTANRWNVVIRGWHADSGRPNLRVITFLRPSFTDVRGSQEVVLYSPEPPGGFVAAGQAWQKAEHAVRQQPQLEALSWFILDINTGGGVAGRQRVDNGALGPISVIWTNMR